MSLELVTYLQVLGRITTEDSRTPSVFGLHAGLEGMFGQCHPAKTPPVAHDVTVA